MPFTKRNVPSTAFKPGISGNPSGRPKYIGKIQELARKYTGEAIEMLVALMRDEKASSSVRAAAAIHLLDRGYGKPAQSLEHTGDGVTLQIVTGIHRAPDEPLVLEAGEPEASEPQSSIH